MTFWKSYDLWVGSLKRNRYETKKQRRRGKRKIQTEHSSESLLKKTKPHSTHSQPFRVRKQSGKRTPKANSSRCVGFSSQTKKYPILTREHSNAWNSGDEERKKAILKAETGNRPLLRILVMIRKRTKSPHRNSRRRETGLAVRKRERKIPFKDQGVSTNKNEKKQVEKA